MNENKRMSDKYLVLGSAPYMRDWVATHLNWFVTHKFTLVTFNNSWHLLDRLNVEHEYHMSDDHETAGTFVMDHDARKRMGPMLVRHVSPECSDTDVETLTNSKETGNRHYRVCRSKFGKNTMFFDMVQYFIDQCNERHQAVVFVGCDMMYKSTDDTFYKNVPDHKARPDIVLAYDNDFDRVALEFNDKFDQITKRTNKGISFYNASEFETRLPFERFTAHLSGNPCGTCVP